MDINEIIQLIELNFHKNNPDTQFSTDKYSIEYTGTVYQNHCSWMQLRHKASTEIYTFDFYDTYVSFSTEYGRSDLEHNLYNYTRLQYEELNSVKIDTEEEKFQIQVLYQESTVNAFIIIKKLVQIIEGTDSDFINSWNYN